MTSPSPSVAALKDRLAAVKADMYRNNHHASSGAPGPSSGIAVPAVAMMGTSSTATNVSSATLAPTGGYSGSPTQQQQHVGGTASRSRSSNDIDATTAAPTIPTLEELSLLQPTKLKQISPPRPPIAAASGAGGGVSSIAGKSRLFATTPRQTPLQVHEEGPIASPPRPLNIASTPGGGGGGGLSSSAPAADRFLLAAATSPIRSPLGSSRAALEAKNLQPTDSSPTTAMIAGVERERKLIEQAEEGEQAKQEAVAAIVQMEGLVNDAKLEAERAKKALQSQQERLVLAEGKVDTLEAEASHWRERYTVLEKLLEEKEAVWKARLSSEQNEKESLKRQVEALTGSEGKDGASGDKVSDTQPQRQDDPSPRTQTQQAASPPERKPHHEAEQLSPSAAFARQHQQQQEHEHVTPGTRRSERTASNAQSPGAGTPPPVHGDGELSVAIRHLQQQQREDRRERQELSQGMLALQQGMKEMTDTVCRLVAQNPPPLQSYNSSHNPDYYGDQHHQQHFNRQQRGLHLGEHPPGQSQQHGHHHSHNTQQQGVYPHSGAGYPSLQQQQRSLSGGGSSSGGNANPAYGYTIPAPVLSAAAQALPPGSAREASYLPTSSTTSIAGAPTTPTPTFASYSNPHTPTRAHGAAAGSSSRSGSAAAGMMSPACPPHSQ